MKTPRSSLKVGLARASRFGEARALVVMSSWRMIVGVQLNSASEIRRHRPHSVF